MPLQGLQATLGLDDDFVARLPSRACRTGRWFRQVVNETVRRGLPSTGRRHPERLEAEARDLGELRAALSKCSEHGAQ